MDGALAPPRTLPRWHGPRMRKSPSGFLSPYPTALRLVELAPVVRAACQTMPVYGEGLGLIRAGVLDTIASLRREIAYADEFWSPGVMRTRLERLREYRRKHTNLIRIARQQTGE